MGIRQKLAEQKLFRGKEDLDLTGGPLKENLFYLALPIVVINLLQTAYGFIDTYWLGQYGETELAAISIAFPVQFLFLSMGFGVSIAGSVLVAQYEGAGKGGKVEEAASQTMSYGLLVSLVIGAAAYFLVGDVVKLLGAEPATVPVATSFLQIISLGLFSIFGFLVFTSLMRSYGDAVTPMVLMVVTVLLNAVLDPVLIFGWWVFPEMGADGAAVVTVLLRSLGLAAGLWILLSGREGLRISLPGMVPRPEYLHRIAKIGVPASAESVGRSLTVNMVVAVVGMFGTTVMAGYGIGVRIFSMIFLPAVAIDRAVETTTGQNLGAGEFERADRVPRIAASYAFLVLTGVGVVCYVLAVPIAELFTTSDNVVAVAADFIRWNALSFGFIGLLRSFSGGFRGAGRTVLPALLAVGTIGLLRLPMAYLLSGPMGPSGIWASFPFSNAAGGLAAVAIYLFVDWKQRVE
jgi:putative MATE family efflux protein